MGICRECGEELTKENTYGEYYKGNICKFCVRKYQNESRKSLPYDKRIRLKVGKSLANHRWRGISVEGTLDDFVETFEAKCAYCGEKFDIYGDFKDAGSIDIIDPNLPMTPNNIQWLCYTCNAGKNHLPHATFMAKIKRIYETHIMED